MNSLAFANLASQDFRWRAQNIIQTYWKWARDDARLIVETDPKLEGPRAEALRILLYLFGQDQAIRLLRSG